MQSILSKTEVHGGLAVVLGGEDSHLLQEIGACKGFLVHALTADAQQAAIWQRDLLESGLLGKACAEAWTGGYLPFADSLVNLLVALDAGGVGDEEILRVLTPEGAALVWSEGDWKTLRKPRPASMDDWSHALHGPDNNAVARDTEVGPPRFLQWVATPRWSRSHEQFASVSVVVSSGGRVFSIQDEATRASIIVPSRWSLTARDAFNGVELWRREVGPWEGQLRGFRSGPPEISRSLVAVDDLVFVVPGYGKAVLILDAATGREVRLLERTAGATEIVCSAGVVYVVTADRGLEQEIETANRRGATPPPRNKRLVALRAATGEMLWEKSGRLVREMLPTTLAVDGERVFFQAPRDVVCLEAQNGEVVWASPRDVAVKRFAWSTPTLVVQNGVVLSAERAFGPEQAPQDDDPTIEWNVTSRGGQSPTGQMIAFSVETGKRLWSAESTECYNAPTDVLVSEGRVWSGLLVNARQPGITRALDLHTGEVVRERPRDQEFFKAGMPHHRCYRNKATSEFLLLGRAGVEFIDTSTGEATANHWIRGTCQYGIMPANGLLYVPPHSCACFVEAKLNGFNALTAHRRQPRSMAWPDAENPTRLEKGPAWGRRFPPIEMRENEWPTLRGNAARWASNEAEAPVEVDARWESFVGSRVTPPVVAEGKVFLAEPDRFSVHALNADTGKRVWVYTTAGRIDSPPTVAGGRAWFGSGDGWVYCVDAQDGTLVWRFRGAPEFRRIVAYDRLESAWPVSGNVLVESDCAWFVAGRSSYLDGGIHLYRLDGATGKCLAHNVVNSRDPETGYQPDGVVKGFSMPGALSDVLAADGGSVFLRHRRYDQNLDEQKEDVPHLFNAAGFVDSNWWHRTYLMYGTKMIAGWNGWLVASRYSPVGRQVVVDGARVYGFGRNSYQLQGSHVGLDEGVDYRLYKADAEPRVTEPPATMLKNGRAKSQGGTRAARREVDYLWEKQPPVLARAMVLAGSTLWLGGPTHLAGLDANSQSEQDAFLLCAVSPVDGATITEIPLDAGPVMDGIAAAHGRLYIACEDGKVRCLSAR